MKNHKRQIIGGLSVLALSTAAFQNLAMAQSAPTSVELAQLIPAEVDQLIEMNTAATNPFNSMADSILTSLTGGSLSSDDQKMEAGKTIVLNELKNNKLSLATQNKWVKSEYGDYSYPETEAYASMHMTAEGFNKLTALWTDAKKETVNGMTVYTLSSDAYVTMVGDLVVVTSTRDRMVMMLDLYTKNSGSQLSKNPDYMAARQKDLNGSFLNMYVNPLQYKSTFEELGAAGELSQAMMNLVSAEKEIMSALKAEGISVSQTPTGFNFSVYVKGDGAKLTQLNLNFDRYNFVPELYKFVNSQNLMVYGEESNLKGKLQDVMKLLMSDPEAVKGFNDWKVALKSQSGVDFDTDILPLFGGKYTMTVHKTNQLFPAVTFIVDVRNMTDKAAGTLTKLVEYANKTFNKMDEEQGVDYFSNGIVSANGTSFYELAFDPSKIPAAKNDLQNLSSDKVVVKIHAAVNPQGFLIITNAPNIGDVYTSDGKGMLNNSNFSSALTAPNEATAGLGYISIDGVHNYVSMVMQDLGAPAEAKTFADGLMKPWHDIFTKAYATTDSTWATGFVNVDVTGFAAYGDLFEKYFATFTPPEDTYDYGEGQNLPILSKSFCDVKSSDWYAEYIDELSSNEIISGYSDGCFKPAKDITRAEFVKMALGAAAKSGLYTPADYENLNEGFYEDQDGWYYKTLDVATMLNYVHGENRSTGKYFRPNDPISRAEAVQILHNIADQAFEPEWKENFNDVNTNDWFAKSVTWAYSKGFVNGVSAEKFEPNRNINRAEAAKIIKLFMDDYRIPGDY